MVRGSILGRCLCWVVGTTDAAMRRFRGVTEFESTREGLLRIEFGHAGRHLRLADGTVLTPGDSVVELHLWNEQLLHVPSSGADFGWATHIRRQALASFHRLALHLRDEPAFVQIKAIRMKPALAARRPMSALAWLLLKIGFESVSEVRPQPALQRFFDNFWLWLLTWTHNPRALKGWRFNRTRREFWISQARFIALYAEGPVLPRLRSGAEEGTMLRRSANIRHGSAGD